MSEREHETSPESGSKVGKDRAIGSVVDRVINAIRVTPAPVLGHLSTHFHDDAKSVTVNMHDHDAQDVASVLLALGVSSPGVAIYRLNGDRVCIQFGSGHLYTSGIFVQWFTQAAVAEGVLGPLIDDLPDAATGQASVLPPGCWPQSA